MTVSGSITEYNKDGSIYSIEHRTMYNVNIGDKVQFCDNSYLRDCYINTIPDEWPMPFGCAATGYHKSWEGRIVKTDSTQYADEKYPTPYGKRIVEMPIAVICDNGEILYCNPLNIKVIESNN